MTKTEDEASEKLVSIKIKPLDSGYFVRAHFVQTTSLMRERYDFKDERSYAFESYEDVDKFIRERI